MDYEPRFHNPNFQTYKITNFEQQILENEPRFSSPNVPKFAEIEPQFFGNQVYRNWNKELPKSVVERGRQSKRSSRAREADGFWRWRRSRAIAITHISWGYMSLLRFNDLVPSVIPTPSPGIDFEGIAHIYSPSLLYGISEFHTNKHGINLLKGNSCLFPSLFPPTKRPIKEINKIIVKYKLI